MAEPLYRVILTGELASGFSREEAMASLARMFETSAAKLLHVFEGTEYPIENVFSAHEAAVLRVMRFSAVAARSLTLGDVSRRAARRACTAISVDAP